MFYITHWNRKHFLPPRCLSGFGRFYSMQKKKTKNLIFGFQSCQIPKYKRSTESMTLANPCISHSVLRVFKQSLEVPKIYVSNVSKIISTAKLEWKYKFPCSRHKEWTDKKFHFCREYEIQISLAWLEKKTISGIAKL